MILNNGQKGQVQRRLIVIDPGMMGLQGHHLGLNKSLLEEAKRRGITPLVFVHDELGRGSLPWCVPYFRTPIYGPLPNTSVDELRRALLFCNEVFYNDLRLLGDMLKLSADDHILVHTANANIVRGLVDFLLELDPQGPSVHIHLMLEPGYGTVDVEEGRIRAQVWEPAAPLLAQLAGRVVFSAETIPLRDLYRSMGIPAEFALVPSVFPEMLTPPVKKPNQILYLGTVRGEKGVQPVVNSIPALLDGVPEARFRFRSPDLTEQMATELRSLDSRVEVDNSPLPDEEFLRELAGSGYCCCFYDPVRYAYRNSNVFWEALAMGTTPIVCAGAAVTQFQPVLGLSNLVVVPHYTATAFAESMVRVMRAPAPRDAVRDRLLAQDRKSFAASPFFGRS